MNTVTFNSESEEDIRLLIKIAKRFGIRPARGKTISKSSLIRDIEIGLKEVQKIKKGQIARRTVSQLTETRQKPISSRRPLKRTTNAK